MRACRRSASEEGCGSHMKGMEARGGGWMGLDIGRMWEAGRVSCEMCQKRRKMDGWMDGWMGRQRQGKEETLVSEAQKGTK